MSFFQALPVNPACDTCRARKVRCDRQNPCGNCQDGNIKCTRTPAAQRRAQSASKRQRSVESDTPVYRSSKRSEPESRPSPASLSASVPQSPSIIEAQDFIQYELNLSRHMEADRKAVLKSAISFVQHLSQVTQPATPLIGRSTSSGDVMEGITYPSIELLYWILRETKSGSFGPYVLDYFKHVSRASLKNLGLALIQQNTDPETCLLSSIIVNSIAFKFINTILSADPLADIETGLRSCAEQHRHSIELAMARMHLLSTPSLLFLQALLCSAFISQGTGDSTSCWSFISTACKVCEDLGLESRLRSCQGRHELTEDEQELYYCFTWCHTLDKNFSLMLGRGRCLLDNSGLEFALSSTFHHYMSGLLSAYLHFALIQGTYITELNPRWILNNPSVMSRVEYIVGNLLERIDSVYIRVNKLRGSSEFWDGLYMESEIRALEFEYHSLRTSILRSRQMCSPRKPSIDSLCLESARMAMSTLQKIQVEARSSIRDVQAHASFMHWTVLYHPLTPFFVLFCNVVATSNTEDFRMLKLVADGLNELTHLSASIAKLQKLFNSFIDLCEGVVLNSPQTTAPQPHLEAQSKLENFTVDLPSHGTMPQTGFSELDRTHHAMSSLATSSAPNMSGESPMPATTDPFDSAWGLFDAQPTLDWLDADFSFFDNNT